MKKLVFFLLAFASLGAMTACDDDDKGSVRVPDAVRSAFDEKFPGAARVEWSGRGGYMVADFHEAGKDMQAWFDAAGKWFMTEEDVPFEQLPEAVRTAFAAGEYAQWRVDDVDKLMRDAMETVYVIEVEQDEREFDLYYSELGVLLRAVADTDDDDDHDDMLPQELPQAVTDFIAQKYPGARIVDIERENGGLEVEIVDGRTPREIAFSADNAWIWTKTEMRRSEVPAVVMNALGASQYAAWEIDDIDRYDAPDKVWYLFELEEPQTEREVKVRIQDDGTIL